MATTMDGGGGKAPGDVAKVAREFRSSVPVGMGCGTSRAVSTQPDTGTEDSLERKRKIKNNRKSSKLNIIDDSSGSKVSEEDLITLPGAVQQSLPPLRKANGTLLQNGFNDDLALTANSLLKKNGPIQEIRDRPRSVDILQELLVQGILNQAHNEEWQEVHSPMFDMKSPEGILKKPPPRLDKLKNETTVQKSATIEEIENKMIAAEERRKMKEIKLKERLNKFNTSPMIMQDGSTRIPPELDQAKLEEVVEKINTKQKEIHQEKQEITKEKDENSELVDETGLTQQESKINTGDCCEVVEFDNGHYLTRKIADEVIVNKI